MIIDRLIGIKHGVFQNQTLANRVIFYVAAVSDLTEVEERF
jgi:hypothetical protein